MKKKSILSMFILITVSSLSAIITIFGLLFLFDILSESKDLEVIIDQTELMLEEGIGVTLDLEATIDEMVETYSYEKMDNALDEVIASSSNDKEALLLHLNSREFIDGIFILDKRGNILYSDLDDFKSNIHELRDDTGKRVGELFSEGLLKEHSLKFSSTWLEDGVFEDYLSIIKMVEDNYYVGIYEKREHAIEYFKENVISSLNTIPDSELLQLIVYDYKGNAIRGHLDVDSDVLEQMIDEASDSIQRYNHPELGQMYYKTYPTLRWLVINKSEVLTNYVREYETLSKKKETRLCVMIHVIVSLLLVTIVFFILTYRKMRKKIDHQITSLSHAIQLDEHLSEDDIKFEEFNRIVKIVNQVKPVKPIYEPKVKEIVVEENNIYVMKELFNQLILSNVHASYEHFDIKALIDKSVEGYDKENTSFNMDVTCDIDVILFQNKALLQGVLRFLVLNILFNSGKGKNNQLSIEVFSDEKQVLINVMRNTSSSSRVNEDDLISKLSECVELGLKGQLISSKYENSTKELTLKFPIVNELTDDM
ncbi:hypothetical protein EZV73_20165 [Acidaminobacter sp. JC074]|uniref:hypothetical protein n=1 Tax=Acidaminobacter sp. JC074 TaxID=2530199 RepID=UPI001F0D6784|nr:hypothetical protein [Acidaminobacter sp. JC074]MCH4889906.1 hypothetical protein [Acidaminobacter sp. JC074]